MALKPKIQALIDFANETTEAGDVTLGDCVKTLADGHNGGANVPSAPLVIPSGGMSAKLAALLAYSNEVTGAGDTRMGDAIRTLCEGYGGGWHYEGNYENYRHLDSVTPPYNSGLPLMSKDREWQVSFDMVKSNVPLGSMGGVITACLVEYNNPYQGGYVRFWTDGRLQFNDTFWAGGTLENSKSYHVSLTCAKGAVFTLVIKDNDSGEAVISGWTITRNRGTHLVPLGIGASVNNRDMTSFLRVLDATFTNVLIEWNDADGTVVPFEGNSSLAGTMELEND